MGTLLLDDLHDAVQNQLTDYANQLGSAAQSAQQAIPQIQTPDAPDPNQILAELQQHAADAAQAVQQQTQQITQPALQVLGQGAQAAGGAVTQLGGNVSQAQDQLAQQLVQHAQDANDTRQQLQDHAATVLGSTDTTQPAGVQSLAVPTPPPTLGAASGDQTTPALGGTTGPVTQPATTSAAAATPDRSMSLQDYARAAAQKAGVDPNVFVAQIQQESGFKTTNADGTPLKSPAGAIGIAQFMPGTAAGMNVDPTDPYAALDAAAQMDAQNLKKYGGDYSKTLAAYNAGGGAVDQYGGVPPYQETQSYVSTILGNAQKAAQAAGTTISNAVGGTASALGSAAQTALGGTPPSDAGGAPASNGYVFPVQGFKGPVQDHWGSVKGGSDLMAPRGTPIVVMAPGVVDESGYNQVGGNSLEIKGDDGNEYYYAHFDAPTALKVGQRVDAGTYVAPVGNTGDAAGGPTHLHIGIGPNILLGADKYGGTGGDYNAVGLLQSTLDGTPPPSQTPTATAPGRTTPPTLGGTSDATPNAPVTMGDNQPAAPLNVDQGNGPTPIQSAQDVAGGAASALGGVANDALEQAKQALQQAQDALGRVAQGAQQAAAPVLGAAQQAVSGAAQDVQQAAQGALGAAQDLNQQTPGTAALNAATPVLGAAASDVSAGAQQASQVLGGAASDVGATVRQTADELGASRDAFAASPIGQRLEQAAIENEQSGPSLLPAGSISLYQDIQQAKNDWLAQNNPLNNLPGPAITLPGYEGELTPGSVIAGLTTGIAQQFTDPVMLALLGPTTSLAGVGSEAVTDMLGPQLADRLAPGAAQVLTAVADKFTSGAIVGGLQNAMFEAEKKDATPQSVGEALVIGAGLGGTIDVGAAGVRPVIQRLGQVLIDQAPTISEALRSRQPAQADVNAALGGVPAVIDRLRGGAADSSADVSAPVTTPVTTPVRTPISEGGLGTPQYGDQPTTPEGQIAQTLREAPATVGISDTAKEALGYDQNTRQLTALGNVPHEVQGDQVLVPGGNADTLRYVASRIGAASGEDATAATLHQFDPNAPDLAGWRVSGIPHAARGELLNDLTTAGIGHQVLSDGTLRVNALPVADAAHEEALAAAVEKAGAKVEEIHGRIATISPEDYQSTLGRFGDRFGGPEGGGVPEVGRRVAEPAAGAGAGAEAGPAVAAAGGGIRSPFDRFGTTTTGDIRPDDLNVRQVTPAEARQLVGPAYDPSGRVTREPPSSPEEEPEAPRPSVEDFLANAPRADDVVPTRTVGELAQNLRDPNGKPGISIERGYMGVPGGPEVADTGTRYAVYRNEQGNPVGVLEMMIDRRTGRAGPAAGRS